MTNRQEFFNAIAKGDTLQIQELLRQEPSLASAANENGVSPILWAAYNRQTTALTVLLNSGIELSIFDAAATGQTNRIREILTADPTLVAAFAPDGFPALGLAAFFGHPEAVRVLMEAGAD